MSSEGQARADLERFFPKPFTEHQWNVLVAQGYEEAISTGARSAEEVAGELRGLMLAAGGEQAGTGAQGLETFDKTPLTWDEMEKLVLGRVLVTGGPTRPRAVSGPGEVGTERHTRTRRLTRRRWWILTACCILVAAVVVAVALANRGGKEPAVSSTTSPAVGSSTSTMASQALSSSTTSTSSTVPTTSSASTTLVDATPILKAQLSGANVVPAVETEASGLLTLAVAADGVSVHYMLTVSNLAELTVARMRQGEAGVDGEEILTIYSGPTRKDVFSGAAAEGSFTADDLVGPLEGKTIADLVALIEAGSVYLVVGTTAHREGELRGQLE